MPESIRVSFSPQHLTCQFDLYFFSLCITAAIPYNAADLAGRHCMGDYMKRLLVMLLFIASYAHAEIYTWADKKGTNHYTNSIYEIPEHYRAKAKILNLGIDEKNESASPQQETTSQPNVPLPVQQYQQVRPASPAQPPEAQRPRVRPDWEKAGERRRH
jgi:hypothetical protein